MEAAGAYLVAIHGRTRDQKNAKEIRADWGVIKVRSPYYESAYY
jgi:tRNA-dihydrouridine synthase